jgi:hypothetical protein
MKQRRYTLASGRQISETYQLNTTIPPAHKSSAPNTETDGSAKEVTGKIDWLYSPVQTVDNVPAGSEDITVKVRNCKALVGYYGQL